MCVRGVVGVGSWWLNILPLIHGSAEREAMLYQGAPEANVIHPMPEDVWVALPEPAESVPQVAVQPLLELLNFAPVLREAVDNVARVDAN